MFINSCEFLAVSLELIQVWEKAVYLNDYFGYKHLNLICYGSQLPAHN